MESTQHISAIPKSEESEKATGNLSTLDPMAALSWEEFSMRLSTPLVNLFVLSVVDFKKFKGDGAISLQFFVTGATHEMMRPDRDLYVKVLEENLQTGSEKNFQKKGTDLYNARDVAFDFDSVMMYGPTDFGILDIAGRRKTTIEPLVPGVKIRCQDE